MQHYEGEWATIEYVEELDAVVVTAHEYAEGEPFRTALDAVVEAAEEHDATRFLADTRELGPIDQEEQLWLVEDWSPRAGAAGLRSVAFVMPESVIANMGLDYVVEMVDDDIERTFYGEPGPAREWLSEG